MKNNRHLTKDETMIIVESFLNPDYDISDKKDKLTDMILNPDNRLMNDEFKAILFNNYWHKEDFEKYDSLSKEFGYELKENLTLIIRFHNLDNNMISKKCNYINQLDFIDDVIKNQLLEENKSYMMRTYFDIIEKLNKIDDIFTQDFNEKFIKKIN